MIFALRACARTLLASALLLSIPCNLHASETDEFAVAVDRASLVHAVLASSPSVRAARGRAKATRREGDAEGRLPPPSVMVQVWQIPLARPWAVPDAQMAMLGVEQELPAPGARGEREAAKVELSHAEEAMARDRARLVARDAEHAFADYLEARARRLVHAAHRELDARMLRVAEARQAAGGSIVEVAQLEAEVARTHADLATDGAREDGARARINALLGRDLAAPIGPPKAGAPEVPAWSAAELARASAARPEVEAARAAKAAETHAHGAAEREATWPAFKVAALYFAPVGPMPAHGYGMNAQMTLPWLWGAAGARQGALEERARAADDDVLAQRLAVDVDVAAADAATRSAARRLQALTARARPAAQRAYDVAWAGYESGRSDLASALMSERGRLDVELEIVATRATLDHALAELSAATGVDVPRVPLGVEKDGEGDDHAR